MNCKNCGALINSSSSVCSSCGTQIENNTSYEAIELNNIKTIDDPVLNDVILNNEVKKNNKGTIISLLIMIIIILSGIAIYLYLDISKKDAQNVLTDDNISKTTTTNTTTTKRLTNEKIIETNSVYKQYEIDLSLENTNKVEYNLNNIKLVFDKDVNTLSIAKEKPIKTLSTVFKIFYIISSDGMFIYSNDLYYYDKTVGLVDVTSNLLNQDKLQTISDIKVSKDRGINELLITGSRISGDTVVYDNGSFNMCTDIYSDYIEDNYPVIFNYSYDLNNKLFDLKLFNVNSYDYFKNYNNYESDHCKLIRTN